MACSICGHYEKTDIHAVLDCPLASRIWAGCGLAESLWNFKFRSLFGCILQASKVLNQDAFGDFLAVMWECWDARNRFIFKFPDRDLQTLGRRAIAFVQSYRDHAASGDVSGPTPHPSTWSPPGSGFMKLNFDAGFISDISTGWGFVLRDHDGNIILAGSKLSQSFGGATVEEARACLYGLRSAHAHGCRNIIIESDCLQLIQML